MQYLRYLTYDEYRRMGGELDEPDFFALEFEAEVEINFFTDRRLIFDAAISQEVKILTFELIDLIGQKNSYGSVESGVVSGVSNDGVSVSYAKQSAQEFLDNYDSNLKKLLTKYLYGLTNQAGEPLIYRGW